MNKYTRFIIKSILILNSILFMEGLTNVQAQESACDKIFNATGDIPQLSDSISISVSNAPFREFIRGIAFNEGINLSVAPDIDFTVSNNFTNVVVADILCFLAREYPIQIDIIGNIIKITKAPEAPKPAPKAKSSVDFNRSKMSMSIDANRDSLKSVCRLITQKTPYNMIYQTDLENLYVNGYVKDLPAKTALEAFGKMNGLILNQISDSVFIYEKPELKVTSNTTSGIPSANNRRGNTNSKQNHNTEISDSIYFIQEDYDHLSIFCQDAELEQLVKIVSDSLGIDYFITGELEGEVSLNLENIQYKDFIQTVFKGTDFTYREENGIMLFGAKSLYEIKEARVISLRYRSVDKLSEIVPADFKQEIEIKEFLDLNSLVVFGNQTQVKQLERFIREIDRLVPVVMIEVIIVDASNKETLSYGITAGMSETPPAPGGSIFPALDYTLDANTINTLLRSFNGFGGVNLGNVSQDFYMSLKFLQDNGFIKIRSTPMLSTLNGTEASLSIGTTEYYVEEQNNLVVNQSTQNVYTKQYKPIKADLSINIKPIVSGDEQITMEIEVNHSDFTGRMEKDAPPGQTSRTFKSMIRVKNNEMVLLGGLEEKSVNDTHSGVPFLSKVPVLKWFFSNSTKDKQKSKLNVFIKPTIIY